MTNPNPVSGSPDKEPATEAQESLSEARATPTQPAPTAAPSTTRSHGGIRPCSIEYEKK